LEIRQDGTRLEVKDSREVVCSWEDSDGSGLERREFMTDLGGKKKSLRIRDKLLGVEEKEGN
jgi:hypothetical protein